jgi:hypothetical protein
MTGLQRSKRYHSKVRNLAKELRILKRRRSKAVRRADFGDEELVLRSYKSGYHII